MISRRRSGGRRYSWTRRNAKSPHELVAEIPNHIRGYRYTPDSHAPPCDTDTNDSKTSNKSHRRSNAIVWEDLVSIVQLEDAEAEWVGPYQKKYNLHRQSCAINLLDDKDILSSSNTNRPTSGNGIGSVIGKMARRLSPITGRIARRMSPPVVRRMSFTFGSRGQSHSSSSDSLSQAFSSNSRSDTYISDSESDTSSLLEYSFSEDENEEDIEAAILASAAVFSQSMNMEDNAISRAEDDLQCAICLDCTDSSNVATVSGCGHTFCFGCIDSWANQKNDCPLCKEKISLVTSAKKVRWY